MTAYVLLFLVWTKMGPHTIPGIFPTRFDCEVAEGELATMLSKDKTVKGWSVVGNPCEAVAESQHV